MPVFKRYLIDQKLRNIDVLVEDRTPNSEHFNVFDLERELPQGRTTFQILGSDALKSNVEIIFKEDLPYEEVQEYIAKTKIGIIPLAPLKKFYRNIPTKMFEYMMHSIPQLASDLPPISFYLNQTSSGFCIGEEMYAVEYADKISEIIKNYPKYSKFAKQDKQFLYEKWNWLPSQDKIFVKLIRKKLNVS